MTAQDEFDSYYTEKIWALIPEVYRTEDGNAQHPNVLRQIVEVIGTQAAFSRRSIDRLWEDQNAETCDDWAVPYIGDLVSTRAVTEHDPRGARVNVARTIFYRRRRGTPALLERLVRELSGWDVILVEAFKRLARMRHRLDDEPARVGTFSQTPQGGTADLRNVRASELVDTPFEEFFRTVDVRRHEGLNGRFNIRKLNFHLYRRNTYSVNGSDPYLLQDTGIPTYTFDPSGRDIPLFARGTQIVDESDCSSPAEWTVRAPIRCRLLNHAEYFLTPGMVDEVLAAPGTPNPDVLAQIVDVLFRSETALAERLLELSASGVRDPGPSWYRTLIALAITDRSAKKHLYPDSVYVHLFDAAPGDDTFRREDVVAGNLGCRTVHPTPSDTGVKLIIDPELGRFAKTDGEEFDPFQASGGYFYALDGDVGAGTYTRGDLAEVTTLASPAGALNGGVTNDDVLTFPDERTYRLRQSESDVISNGVLQAEDGRRPYVLVTIDNDGDEAAIFTPAPGGTARITLDGIWFGSADEGRQKFVFGPSSTPADPGDFDWDEIIIKNCTLDPGGTRADGTTIDPLRIFVRSRVRKLTISRSIVGAIEVPCDSDPPGFVETLEIRDSIVDALQGQTNFEGDPPAAIKSTEGEVRLLGVTVFGGVKADVLNATDTVIVIGLLEVLDQFASCFRFSAASPGGTLPKLYNAEPKQIAEGAPLGPILPSFFTSIVFGDPGYGEIAQTAPDILKFGSEIGSELGAFSFLLRPIRLRTVIGKVEEFKPVGMLAQYILEGEFPTIQVVTEHEEE